MTDLGRDVSCLPDGLRTGRIVSGRRLVAESIARKLSTRPGECPGSPLWGFYLPGRVGAVESKSELAALQGRVRSAIMEDERIDAANVAVTRIEDGFDVRVDARTSDGPFKLVLKVSDVSVEVLGMVT